MTAPTEYLFTPNCIRTVSGRYVNLLDPQPDTLHIEDIAHALSQMPRFGGHLPVHYSVAQHSIWVADAVPQPFKLAALMHDASEAYLMDMPRPLKVLLPAYKGIEQRFMAAIATKYGFDPDMHPLVKAADEAALHREWEGVMLSQTLPILPPGIARELFLQRFDDIKAQQ
jgi:hypothetical protein